MSSKNTRAKRKLQEPKKALRETAQAEHNRQQKLNPRPAINNPYDAEIISVPHTSLGQLRLNYHPHHDKTLKKHVTNAVQREYDRGQFQFVPSIQNKHTLIHGFDKATITYRIPATDSSRNDTLLQSIQNLPTAITDDYEGTDRGQFNRRHYCVWCSYAREPYVSSQFIKDGEAAAGFMDTTKSIWDDMTVYLQKLFPAFYKEFTAIPLPGHLRRMCGAWMGCVVNYQNQEEDSPVVTPPHRDVKERVFGVSCLCPFGNYEGGNLILWELKLIIELKPGDLLFFPDSLIHHSNEAVKPGGERNSVVAFTQQNMFDYWKRQDGQDKIERDTLNDKKIRRLRKRQSKIKKKKKKEI